jgi:hypothetical protein
VNICGLEDAAPTIAHICSKTKYLLLPLRTNFKKQVFIQLVILKIALLSFELQDEIISFLYRITANELIYNTYNGIKEEQRVMEWLTTRDK